MTTPPITSAAPPIAQFAAAPTAELIEMFARGANRLSRRVLELDDAQLDTFFRPEAGVGRWSCRVLVGHLADADLAFVHRMRRIAAEDGPVLAPFDEDAFIDGRLYDPHLAPAGSSPGNDRPLPVAGSVAVIHTVRLWTADWLRTLADSAFARRGLHPQRGELTLRDILVYACWHVENHAWFLDRKLDRLLGPAQRE